MRILEKQTEQGLHVFRGDVGNPFLAPRGVWLSEKHLIVADTGQNRVFVWDHVPQQGYAKPTVVLGQADPKDTQRNAGQSVSAQTLHYPSGIWTDDQRLIVADAWNHRVLIWHSFPTSHGQAADVVLGQKDFSGNQPNQTGIGATPSASTLNWPYGVFSDGKQLWIADTGNRRVLYFEQIPTSNTADADAVIGQPDFESRDYDSQHAIWPYSVKISASGQMAITDTQYYRVLLWQQWQDSFTQEPDAIIGQPDLQSNGQNQYFLQPDAHTLSWCYDSFFADQGLWVADTGNSRLLHFPSLPTENNTKATGLFGQEDFHTGSENPDTIMGTESTLYWPFSLCIHQNILALADTGNHRLILKKLNYHL